MGRAAVMPQRSFASSKSSPRDVQAVEKHRNAHRQEQIESRRVLQDALGRISDFDEMLLSVGNHNSYEFWPHVFDASGCCCACAILHCLVSAPRKVWL
eukprot:5605794-Amphidinium_carterae.1